MTAIPTFDQLAAMAGVVLGFGLGLAGLYVIVADPATRTLKWLGSAFGGESPGQQLPTPSISILPARSSGSRCPVCAQPVHGRVRICSCCSVPTHPECWDYLGGCGIFACAAAPQARSWSAPAIPVPERIDGTGAV
ncbi:MAG: hypothetical protein HY815_08690 [Candidatus Riflebacteria bacterium]|nr:hypothetical protein [Candidatus Riflebacteria bacterium]